MPAGRPDASRSPWRMSMIARSLARVALVGTALFALPAAAQDKASTEPWTLQQALGDPEGLTVSGSARIRYETLSNQFRPGLDKNDDLISLRTSLFAEYDTGPIRLGGELIDARA